MKILFILGTRPEVIKLSPLINESSKVFDVKVLITGQHSSLLDPIYSLLPFIDFKINMPSSRSLESFIITALPYIQNVIKEVSPDLVIIQGDTASGYTGALAAFLSGVKIGHVEAGLRTYDIQNPFPEEFFRQSIARMANYHWCSSEISVENLKKEFITENVLLTGNTIIDYLSKRKFEISRTNLVPITLHRRENKDKFENLFQEINKLSTDYPKIDFMFISHPNPNVQKHLNIIKNIRIVDAISYEVFLKILAKSFFIISDSGGIQEEALFFRKKIIIAREKTERPEVVDAGLGKLSYNISDNIAWAMEDYQNDQGMPYGDGTACQKIIENIQHEFRTSNSSK